jgi:hypothetical protein
MKMKLDDIELEPSHAQNQDRMLHAAIARATYGLSPASLIAAYMDWVTHLAISPGKQQQLSYLLPRVVRRFRPWRN